MINIMASIASKKSQIAECIRNIKTCHLNRTNLAAAEIIANRKFRSHIFIKVVTRADT